MVRFLGLFEVVGPQALAVDAVLSNFTTRPAVPDAFVFSISVLKMNSVFFASCNCIRFYRARGVQMPFSLFWRR